MTPRKSSSFFSIGNEHNTHNDHERFSFQDALLLAGDKDEYIPSSPTDSIFVFETPLGVPLSQSVSKHENELERTVGVWSGMGLLIGASIGSGIFSSPGPVLQYTQSAGGALLAWMVAGLIAMLGGLCYAELGTMMPSSGGDYTYLSKAYGSLPAFLFSVSSIIISNPGSNAIVSVVSAEYLCKLFYFSHPDGADAIPWWLSRLLGIGILGMLTGIHLWSTRATTALQNVLTVLKLGSIVVISAFGMSKLVQGPGASRFEESVFDIPSVSAGNASLAIYSALWAYDGWNNLNFVAGEMHDPAADLPRAIIGSSLIVMSSYLIVNVAYYAVLSPAMVMKTQTIALEFGKKLFGHAGSLIIPIIVISATVGTLNVGIFTGARIAYATGKEGGISWLGKLHKRTKTPWNAIILESAFTILFILHGDFKSLVNFYSMISYSFYFLSVMGLIILRVTHPFEDRPFKPWIGIPITFCLLTLAILLCSIVEAPYEAISAAVFFISGAIVYFGAKRVDFDLERLKDTVCLFASRIPIAALQQFLERRGYSRQMDLDQYEMELTDANG